MAKNKLRWLDATSVTLLTIGGINWGLDALGYNVVELIANGVNLPVVANTIYTLVAVSAVWVGIRALMGKIKLVK